MEKRVRFQSRWLPWALVAPQMIIVLVFFFWPAGQALYQSVLQQDAFGTATEFVDSKTSSGCWPTAPTLNPSRPLLFSRCWWPSAASLLRCCWR
jgi:ABC-type sugar transport system permease subunit